MTIETIKTNDGPVEIDVEATRKAFARLNDNPELIGMDGIDAVSCIYNGIDTADELGVCELERGLAEMYYAVKTAEVFELEGF